MTPISIYKPNKNNEGCACSFYVSRGMLFLNAIKQFSWDEANRTGSFAENAKNQDKSVSVKLNEWEAGGLIGAIERWEEWKAYHTYEENKTSLSFKPWTKKDDAQTKAFGLSITRNSTDTFRLPIELSEAQVIKQYLINFLNLKFNADPETPRS